MLRRVFHVVAAMSLVLFLASALMWIASYVRGMDWELRSRNGIVPILPEGFGGSYGTWNTYRWIGTSSGRIQFLERTVEAPRQPGSTPRMRVGYWVLNTPGLGATGRRYVLADPSWRHSSVLHYATPAQISGAYVPQVRMLPFVRLTPAVPAARGSGVAGAVSVSATRSGVSSFAAVGSATTQQSAAVIIGPSSSGNRGYTINGVVQSPGMSYRSGVRTLIISWWIPTLLFAILPSIAVVSIWRRVHLVRRNCCAACGYNLTGNKSGVCPECGTEVKLAYAITS